MKKVLALLGVMVLMICSTSAVERETIWPKGKMPHPQEGQIAAMTDEVAREGFNPKKNKDDDMIERIALLIEQGAL